MTPAAAAQRLPSRPPGHLTGSRKLPPAPGSDGRAVTPRVRAALRRAPDGRRLVDCRSGEQARRSWSWSYGFRPRVQTSHIRVRRGLASPGNYGGGAEEVLFTFVRLFFSAGAASDDGAIAWHDGQLSLVARSLRRSAPFGCSADRPIGSLPGCSVVCSASCSVAQSAARSLSQSLGRSVVWSFAGPNDNRLERADADSQTRSGRRPTGKS